MPGVNAFENNVERYEQWFVDNPLAYVSELRAVRELLPMSGSGIEIGLGTGRFAAPLGITKGIEPSRSMAELARKKGIEVIPGVAEHLPFKDREFGFVLMVTTVCFLDDMELSFQEVSRVLKPGGSFVIGFVDRDSPLGKEYQKRKAQSVFYQHATFYSTDDIASHLQRTGFGNLAFRQTLFRPLAEMVEVEPVKEGHGQGSFVVVRGEKSETSLMRR
jgi:SAM-dependent methyltransferase